MSARARVRAARLTDLAALGELSRLAQGDAPETRSLGLPLAGPPISVFSLFRLPLGAFRPHDLMYVYEDGGRLSGLLRVERDQHRDEWTIVELDAIGFADAGDIRYRLLQYLMRDATRRGVARFHVACTDTAGNVELFMQAGFARYGEEIVLFRPPDEPLPQPLSEDESNAVGIRPAEPTDAVPLHRLYAAATPQPVQRIELLRLAEWERPAAGAKPPRSSLTPILRFADVEVFVAGTPSGGADGTSLDGLLQVGVAKEDQPHYLRAMVRPGLDASPLVRYGLGVIHARTRPEQRSRQGVIAPVRTYESPLEHRFEEAGFQITATVTLLMKETLVRVAEPVLVPAVR